MLFSMPLLHSYQLLMTAFAYDYIILECSYLLISNINYLFSTLYPDNLRILTAAIEQYLSSEIYRNIHLYPIP